MIWTFRRASTHRAVLLSLLLPGCGGTSPGDDDVGSDSGQTSAANDTGGVSSSAGSSDDTGGDSGAESSGGDTGGTADTGDTSGSEGDTGTPGEATVFEFSFDADLQGWVEGFADYPVGEEEFYELDAGWEPLPAPLDGHGFFITGNNHSDDLFMYLQRRVDGLQPSTTYRVDAQVQFATSAGSNCVGVGGAPGESVVVKIGAVGSEPTRSVDGNDHYRLDVDKGNQETGGTQMATVGDVANGTEDCSGATWVAKTLSGTAVTEVTADDEGAVWLLIGSDSGFEATTSLYYIDTRFELTPTE